MRNKDRRETNIDLVVPEADDNRSSRYLSTQSNGIGIPVLFPQCQWLAPREIRKIPTFQPTAKPKASSTYLAQNWGIAPGRGSQVAISPRDCIFASNSGQQVSKSNLLHNTSLSGPPLRKQQYQ